MIFGKDRTYAVHLTADVIEGAGGVVERDTPEGPVIAIIHPANGTAPNGLCQRANGKSANLGRRQHCAR